VLILILYFAYIGQAWNIMMGFAGQLSLGHALYVGLGAYTTAALFVHFGIGPWLGLAAALPLAALMGAIIGFLAFRFRVAGVGIEVHEFVPAQRPVLQRRLVHG
jgi:branched-chain amino acid transport system permease protein